MSIESWLLEAIKLIQDEKFDKAMYLACSSLDATAKNEFGAGSKRRFQQFIEANLDIITCVGFGGAILATPGSTVKLKQPESPTECISIEDIIYKSLRCYLTHEASLPANVSFTKDAFYGERNGVFHIPVLMIYAVVLCVIAAPSNFSRSLGSDIVMTLNGKQLHLERLWGAPNILRKQLGIEPGLISNS